MFCTNCGNKLNQNDKFCNLCGTPNIVDQSNQETEINLIENERDLTNQESDNLIVNMEKENKQEEKETRTEKSEIIKIKNISVLNNLLDHKSFKGFGMFKVRMPNLIQYIFPFLI